MRVCVCVCVCVCVRGSLYGYIGLYSRMFVCARDCVCVLFVCMCVSLSCIAGVCENARMVVSSFFECLCRLVFSHMYGICLSSPMLWVCVLRFV